VFGVSNFFTPKKKSMFAQGSSEALTNDNGIVKLLIKPGTHDPPAWRKGRNSMIDSRM
jgi:hypothetical protein